MILNLHMKSLLDQITASQLFHVYLFDREGYTLYSNDPEYSNWSRYLQTGERLDFGGLIAKTRVVEESRTEELYLGIAPVGKHWMAGALYEAMGILFLIVLPGGLLLAFFLAKIPKRLFDELEENQKSMFRQSRKAAIGEMTTSIAHQWRQPLNLLAVVIQDLQEAYRSGEVDREYIERMVEASMEAIDEMSAAIDSFRSLAKNDREVREFGLLSAVSEVVRLFEEHLKSRQIALTVEGEDFRRRENSGSSSR